MGIYRQNKEAPLEFFNRITKRFQGRMQDKIIRAGIYDLTETDGGGMRDEFQATVEVTSDMTEYHLALQLFHQYGYYNAWGYIQYNKHTPSVTYKI